MFSFNVCSFQIETHPYLQQSRLVRYAQSLGVHVTAYSPLGNGTSYWNEAVSTLKEDEIKRIAEKHSKKKRGKREKMRL